MGNTNTANLIATYQFNDAGTYKNGSAINTNGVLPMAASIFKLKSSASRTQVFSLGFNSTSTDRDWQGHYSEWIFTDGTEDLATQQKVEGYLAHKWGLAANLPAEHPYKNAAPGTPSATVTLAGTATDADNDLLTTTWSVVGGDLGFVTFADDSATNTTVSFTTNGVYTLRLTADDGFGQNFDECVITVGDGYAVIYDGNTSTGGNVPADGNIYTNGATVTVLGNTGALVKSGYAFNDWSTTTNGIGGTAYAAAATFSMPASNVTLYAQWEALPTYALTVNNGSGDGTYAVGVEVPIVADIPQVGYRFANWTTADGGSFADANAASTVYTMPGNAATVTANFVTNNLPVVDAGPDQGVAMNGFIPWTPAELATAAWYDASDSSTLTTNGNSVSEWRDKSGNTNHAVQANASLQPQTGTGASAINGLNTLVSQAAVGEFMTMPRAITLSDYSVFGVLKADSDPVDALTRMGVLAGTSNAWDGFTMSFMEPSGGIIRANTEDDSGKVAAVPLGTCTSLTTPFIYSNVRVKSPVNIDTYYYNGNSGNSGGALTNNLTLKVLFRGYAGQIGGNGQPWNGSVGEVIVVNSALSADLRLKVEGYLAHKWGLTTNLPTDHPYKTVPPGTPTATATLEGSASDADDDTLTTTWSVVGGDPAAFPLRIPQPPTRP
jgi:hypothetical protein